MTRHTFTIGAAAAALTFSLAATAWAQAGSRPNNTGSSTGTAEPRGGGSSGTAVPSGSGSSSGSSSSGSGSTMGSGGFGAPSSGGGVYDSGGRRSAPQRAVPRNPASGGGGDRSSAAAPAGSRRNPENGAVPSYSRPREGRAVTGEVTERRTPISRGDNFFYYPYSYYFDPYYFGGYGYRYGYYSPYYSRYWMPGYGYGFGYFAYDPFWYDPFYYGGGGAYAGGYSRQYNATGSLRLKVKPGHAQVYVDGYYVGVVDSFDGVFQRLSLDAGTHRIEVKAEGFETVQFEVNLRPGETVTYKGELVRQ